MNIMGAKVNVVVLKTVNSARLIKWKVKEGAMISIGRVLLIYELDSAQGKKEQKKLKSTHVGTIKKLIPKEQDIIQPGEPLLELEECRHPTVMKDMCAECGADLTKLENNKNNASVSMVHTVPELKVSHELAQILGNEDKDRLIELRKLVLLVDLDQTLIHTTNDDVPPTLKDVYHFQLQPPNGPWYHTRLRPNTLHFLNQMSEFYELHICTFGARNYAHAVANILDQDGKFFSNRILSRDECFDPNSKTANLKALFPCGDDMVCIIDDREDVWNYLPNLIHVKPYHYFKHTGDINAPPGLTKQENDEKHGIEFKNSDTNYKDPNNACTVLQIQECLKEEISEKNENAKEKQEIPKEEAIERNKNAGIAKEKEEILNDEIIEKNNQDTDISEQENKDSLYKENPETAKEEEHDILDDDDDDYLLYLADILKTVHSAYYELYNQSQAISYSQHQPDLKKVVPYVRRKALAGFSLVFSGLVPTHTPLKNSRPFRVARALGASVTQDLTLATTHLVAARPGTVKSNNALRRSKIHIVSPQWLWACAERWQHVDERLFPLIADAITQRHPPPHCSPEHPSRVAAGAAAAAESYYQTQPSHRKRTPAAESYYQTQPSHRKRTPSERFAYTINPLLTLSHEDLKTMEGEVEDICMNDSEEDEGEIFDEVDDESMKFKLNVEHDQSTSSSESLAGDSGPRGWSRHQKPSRKRLLESTPGDLTTEDDDEEGPRAKFRRGEEDIEEPDELPENDDSLGSDGEWCMMGAALEREFLSSNQDD